MYTITEAQKNLLDELLFTELIMLSEGLKEEMTDPEEIKERIRLIVETFVQLKLYKFEGSIDSEWKLIKL